MMISQSILFSSLLLMLLQLKTKSQLLSFLCDTSSNYSTNSTFSTNLNLLLSSLIMKTPQTGFFNDTQGLVPNRVYGLALCRGDISSEDCTDCLQTASTDMPNLCPYNKGSTVWYDSCLVRFENYDFFSNFDVSQGGIYYFLTNISDPVQFKDRLVMMIGSISKFAAFNASNRYFSTGLTNVSGEEEIYGMVQCTRDLSTEQCFNCLNDSLSKMLSCCYGLEGVMSLTASCVLRYDSDKFFNSNPAWVAPPSLGPGLDPPSQAPQFINFTKKGKGKKTVPIALGIGIPLVLSSALAIFLLICLQRRKRSRNRIKEKNIQELKGRKSLLFEFSTLQEATEHFSDINKLGEGGFGPVYKGKLRDGQEIAVKRLSKGSNQGRSELMNEVQFLAELQHKNLVRLLGVCMEKEEMLLVYEYICNKSLDTLIFDDESRRKLNWEERLKIIQGISRGLLYLHQDSAIRIVHRDLKAGNILLDENLNPKISDFGLARLLGGDHTQSKTSKVVGTYGYMAPEYAVHGTVSTKVDVFSFGVLILEIITGRSNSSFSGTSAGNLLNYTWEHWTNGTATELIDPYLGDETWSNDEAVRCINIALLCAQMTPNERPNIFSVNLMLTRKRMQVPPPSSPAFVFGDSSIDDRDFEISDSSTSRSSVKYSNNEVTCTEPYPR